MSAVGTKKSSAALSKEASTAEQLAELERRVERYKANHGVGFEALQRVFGTFKRHHRSRAIENATVLPRERRSDNDKSKKQYSVRECVGHGLWDNAIKALCSKELGIIQRVGSQKVLCGYLKLGQVMQLFEPLRHNPSCKRCVCDHGADASVCEGAKEVEEDNDGMHLTIDEDDTEDNESKSKNDNNKKEADYTAREHEEGASKSLATTRPAVPYTLTLHKPLLAAVGSRQAERTAAGVAATAPTPQKSGKVEKNTVSPRQPAEAISSSSVTTPSRVQFRLKPTRTIDPAPASAAAATANTMHTAVEIPIAGAAADPVAAAVVAADAAATKALADIANGTAFPPPSNDIPALPGPVLLGQLEVLQYFVNDEKKRKLEQVVATATNPSTLLSRNQITSRVKSIVPFDRRLLYNVKGAPVLLTDNISQALDARRPSHTAVASSIEITRWEAISIVTPLFGLSGSASMRQWPLAHTSDVVRNPVNCNSCHASDKKIWMVDLQAQLPKIHCVDCVCYYARMPASFKECVARAKAQAITCPACSRSHMILCRTGGWLRCLACYRYLHEMKGAVEGTTAAHDLPPLSQPFVPSEAVLRYAKLEEAFLDLRKYEEAERVCERELAASIEDVSRKTRALAVCKDYTTRSMDRFLGVSTSLSENTYQSNMDLLKREVEQHRKYRRRLEDREQKLAENERAFETRKRKLDEEQVTKERELRHKVDNAVRACMQQFQTLVSTPPRPPTPGSPSCP